MKLGYIFEVDEFSLYCLVLEVSDSDYQSAGPGSNLGSGNQHDIHPDAHPSLRNGQ